MLPENQAECRFGGNRKCFRLTTPATWFEGRFWRKTPQCSFWE
jgi:hypothetical protein